MLGWAGLAGCTPRRGNSEQGHQGSPRSMSTGV
jgi:hypothetical protein